MDKMKNKEYHSVGTGNKSDIKDQRNRAKIDAFNSFIHDRSLSLLVTGASIKKVAVLS